MEHVIYQIHDPDSQIRAAARDHVKLLTQVYGDEIPWSAVAKGFLFHKEQILIANKAVGIFKPRQMQMGALSIKTTIPRAGRINRYVDAEDSDGTFIYSLQGEDPNNHHNRALRECYENNLPIIYFHAVAASVYKAIFPCFIENIDTSRMICKVSVASELISADQHYALRDSEAWKIERRYALRETNFRLHQAGFRHQVLAAYGKRCAMTLLPVPQLLEAAHIVPDSHELGEAGVKNGICLSRIHHRAFDANLIGVNTDFQIQVSEKLMRISDGPILENGLKALHGKEIVLPKARKNWPSRDLLDIRFNEFKRWT